MKIRVEFDCFLYKPLNLSISFGFSLDPAGR